MRVAPPQPKMSVGALSEPMAVRTFSLYASLANHSTLICASACASFHLSKEVRQICSCVPPVTAQALALPSAPPPGFAPPHAESARLAPMAMAPMEAIIRSLVLTGQSFQ